MSKTDASFLSALQDSEAKARNTEPESVSEVNPVKRSVSTPDGKPKRGRPSSFDPEELVVRKNYRIGELDAEAMELYLKASPDEMSYSGIVCKAIRAYIPEQYYAKAKTILALKHS